MFDFRVTGDRGRIEHNSGDVSCLISVVVASLDLNSGLLWC